MAVAERSVVIRHTDFSSGIVSRVSPKDFARLQLTAVKDAINAIFRPKRAFAIRRGCFDTATTALIYKPTSIFKWLASGGNKTYVGVDDGVGGGKLYRHTASGDALQTHAGLTLSSAKMHAVMANRMLVMAQIGNSAAPYFYSSTNATDTWLPLTLPAPAAAPTFGADQVGGSITPTINYYYRVRWVYANGASKTSPVSAATGVVAASGSYTIRVNIPLPGAPRTDFVGWILERTIQDSDGVNGPFYRVTQQLAAVTTWDDAASDASLDYESDETIHGEPIAMNGVIFHKNRLWGWKGSTVYISQPVIGEEATGLCNWVGDASYPLDDDSDDIVACVKQGDRLLFGKKASLYVIEGDDVDSFRKRRIYAGVGMIGPRAYVSLGPTVFFYAGDGAMFMVRGDSVEPVWEEELGDQLAMMDPTYDFDVLGVNYKGRQVLFCHRRKDSTAQRDWIGWDLLVGNALRFRDPPAVDAVAQVDRADFGGAPLLLADPVLREPVLTTSPSQNPSFAVWRDQRGASTQVFAQSLDSLGVVRWAANGVQASNSTLASQVLENSVCGDGSGGIYVAFCSRDATKREIFVQRFDAGGATHAGWAVGGTQITNNATGGASPPGNGPPVVCSDGAGGCIVAWMDTRAGTPVSAYAQRVDAAGAVQWTANGLLVHTGSGVMLGYMQIVPRSGGGAWVTSANGSASAGFLWTSINGAGAVVATGSAPVTGLQTGAAARIARDSTDGLLIAYQAGTAADVSVRRISAAGAVSWTATATAGRTGMANPQIVSDGAGGAIVAWYDNAGALNDQHIRAQRVTSAGALAWVVGGVPLCGNTSVSLQLQSAVMDGSGGAIFGWYDSANLASVQKVDSTGQWQWGTNGVALASAGIAPILSTDGAGGCIALLFAASSDLRAVRVTSAGATPWGASGTIVVNATGIQDIHKIVFTDTPVGEYPPTAVAGYHVWGAFSGTTDFADNAGLNGSPIAVMVQSHRYDGGASDEIKVAQRIEVDVDRGKGRFSIAVKGDPGRLASLSLEATAQAVQYNSGVKYNSGAKYATTGQTTVESGLAPNTEGRGLSVTFSGEFTDELEIGGWTLDAKALPVRRMSG